MPGCDSGRNVQKYKGGGGGSASTLQEALENSNVASINIELINGAKYIGDGSLLTNIPGVGGSVGTLQQVTTAGDSTNKTTNFTNSVTAIKTTGNVFVGAGLYGTSNVTANIFYGDGGCLANTAATAGIQEITNTGNATTQVVSFNHGTTSLTAASNVRVVGNVYATGFNGGGYHVTGLDASKIDHGTLPVVRGGTGVTSSTGSGNLVLSAGPTLSGTITGGTFSGSGSGLTSLNATNISSGTLSNDRLSSKTGSGNIVMSASPTLSGTITGGTFSGTHSGNGSGLSSLNASNISSGTLSNDRLSSKTGSGNIVMSASPTLSGTITGGTFSGSHSGDGSGLSSLNAGNIGSGTLTVSRGGTGANTLNNLIALGTHTTGNYVSTISGGDGIQSTGGTSGENIGHTLSLDLKSNHGLAIDSGELKVNLKSNGGLAFESGQLALKLNDQSITGDLGAGKGGTGITSYSTGDILYASGGSVLSKLVSNATTSGWFLKCVSGGAPQWADVSQVGSANPYAHIPGTDLTGGNYTGAGAVTWNVSSDASASNNSIVKRDGNAKITAAGFIGSVADFNTGTLGTARLPTVPVSKGGTGATTKTGTGANVLSASPDFTGTVTVSGTGGKFSGLHEGNGSGLTHLNLGDGNNTGQVAVARGGTGATTTTGGGTGAKNVLSINPTFTGTVTGTFSGSGASLTSLPTNQFGSSVIGVGNGGTGQNTFAAKSVLIGNNTSGLSTVAPLSGSNIEKYLRFSTDGSGNPSIDWNTVSSSGGGVTASVIDDDSTCHPAFFKDGSTSTSVHMNNSFKFNSQTSSLYVSNIFTEDTTTHARNGISNTTSTHTLSVGTVVSIQETSTGDVLIVRGNGYFNDDVYIAKKLTMPSGSTLTADTIKVRSMSVKETMVVAERPVSTISQA